MELLREGRARPEFGRFVTGWTDHLPRTAYLTAWDLAEAEDPVQETLLRVAGNWMRIRALEHSPQAPLPSAVLLPGFGESHAGCKATR